MAATAVTLLTLASQAKSGTSTPLDVSAFTQLRLDIQLRADLGKIPEATVAIETGPLSTGPFTEIYSHQFSAAQPSGAPNAWPAASVQKLNLSPIAEFVRVKWSARATANTSDGDPSLQLGCSGLALP